MRKNNTGVYHQLLRGEVVGASTKEKILSLPSWMLTLTLEGCTVKSDALGLEKNAQTHMTKQAKQIKE